MDPTGRLPWPPSPAEAPIPDEIPSALEELFIHGTRAYRRSEERSDLLERLAQRLDDESRALLMAYEAHTNQLAAAWGDDRFRIGFALGGAFATRQEWLQEYLDVQR